MGDELSLTTEEIDDLAARLDASGELSDRDREVLHGLFALAGVAVGSAQPVEDAEVAGFAVGSTGPSLDGLDASQSFQQGYQQVGLGLRKSAGGNASGVMYLQFNFKLVAVKTISWAHDD